MQQLMQLYAPRCPMAQLLGQYRVTKANPKPPTLHFALPHLNMALYEYADEYGLTTYLPCDPTIRSPQSLFLAAEHLSEYVDYELSVAFPFLFTADCTSVLVLYNNYTRKKKRLVPADEEDVIEMVQEALGYDKSVRPKWYFDALDPWEPGDDEDADTN